MPVSGAPTVLPMRQLIGVCKLIAMNYYYATSQLSMRGYQHRHLFDTYN